MNTKMASNKKIAHNSTVNGSVLTMAIDPMPDKPSNITISTLYDITARIEVERYADVADKVAWVGVP